MTVIVPTPHRRRLCVSLVLLTLAVVPAGCGISRPASPASTASAPHPSVKVILRRMRRSLNGLHSFGMHAWGTEMNGRRVTMRMTVAAPHRFQVKITTPKLGITERFIGQGVWVRLAPAVWQQRGWSLGAAELLAQQWFLPDSTEKLERFGSEVAAQLTGRDLARCLVLSGMSGLRFGGTGTINGFAADELISRGTRPGTAKGRLWVSAIKPYLPLRQVQTSPYRRGGKAIPACHDTAADQSRARNGRHGVTTFGAFNDPIHLDVPRHVYSHSHPFRVFDPYATGVPS
jgi:hypothetical protein